MILSIDCETLVQRATLSEGVLTVYYDRTRRDYNEQLNLAIAKFNLNGRNDFKSFIKPWPPRGRVLNI